MTASTDTSIRARAFGRGETLAGLAVVAILGLALGLAALLTPPTHRSTREVTYNQSGTFSYAATAPSSSLYAGGRVTTGDPILTDVVGPLRASFAYRLTPAPAGVHGTATLDAVVTLPGGFSRTFPVAARQAFTGPGFVTSGVLPLPAIMSFVSSAGRALGPGGVQGVTVFLRPGISLTGRLAGHPLTTSYSPKVQFSLNEHTLTLSQPDGFTGPATTQLRPALQGTVSYRSNTPTTLPLVVAHPSRSVALTIGFGLAVLCLLLGWWLARPSLGAAAGERHGLRALRGSQVVPIRSLTVPADVLAEVASVSALADIAKRYDSMIMHLPDEDAYLVWDNGMLFRYSSAPAVPTVVALPDIESTERERAPEPGAAQPVVAEPAVGYSTPFFVPASEALGSSLH